MSRFSYVGAYIKLNILRAMEYRGGTFSQVFGMILNDAIWLLFWALYFQKFPIVKGWQIVDIINLWAIITVSFGVVAGLFSNSANIPALISQGRLDYFLALPRNVLAHISVSEIRPFNLGDIFFGVFLFFFFGNPTFERAGIFILTCALAICIWYGVFVFLGSLAFFFGNSERFSEQCSTAMVLFSSYPSAIFEGKIRFFLTAVFPCFLVSSVPVQLIREFSIVLFMQLLGGAVVFMAIGVGAFTYGLRKYESGNMTAMRS